MPGGGTSHVKCCKCIHTSPHLLCRGLASFDPPLDSESQATVHHLSLATTMRWIYHGRWPIYATYSRYTLELRDRWAFTCEKKKQHQKNTGTRVEKWKFPAPLPNNCADEIAFRSYGLTWFKLRMCAPASHLYTLPLTASKREKKNREEIS